MATPNGRTDEELVLATRAGERDAYGTLAQRWFDRCWDVAWRILRDRDHAADVAQDTLLKAWQQLDHLDQPASFGGWVLRISRNRALDRLEKERRAVPTDDDYILEPRRAEQTPIADPSRAFAQAQEQDLVWAAATALGERDASVLDLYLRHGLEPHELADELGIAPNAAHQALFRMRKRLGDAIRSWLVWRGGRPSCVALRAELAAAGIERFDAVAAKLIDRHGQSCSECAHQRKRVVAPSALFSSVPLMVPPPDLRAAAFERLAHAGVPTGSPPAAPATEYLPGPTTQQPPVSGTQMLPAFAPGPPPHQPAEDTRLAPVLWAGAAVLIVLALIGAWWLWLPSDESRQVAAPSTTATSTSTATSTTSTTTVSRTTPTTTAPTSAPSRTVQPPPPVTTTRTTTSSSSAPAVPASIDEFTVVVTGKCVLDGKPSGSEYELYWTTSDAVSATLVVTPPKAKPGTPEDVPTTYKMTRCEPSNAEFTLEATGAGGDSVSETRTGAPQVN